MLFKNLKGVFRNLKENGHYRRDIGVIEISIKTCIK